MAKLLRLLLFTIIGLLFLFYLFYGEYDVLPNLSRHFNIYAFTFIASTLTGFGIFYINQWLNQRIPWRRHIFGRFMAGFALDFTFLGGLLLMMGWLANLTGIVTYEMFAEDMFIRQIEIKLIVLCFLTMFVVTLVEFNTFSYNEYSVGQIRKLRAERKQLELQFEALKSQLSPHYLFNSMNTISSLVYRDPHVAENFIRNLADTFNYVLYTKEAKVVTIREEIEALKDYGYLLNIRYAAAVDLRIEIDSQYHDRSIPPLTLQLLVENAVKHNIISNDNPLKVNIRATEDEVIVLNNKTGSPSKTASHRVGLENIRKRYAFFTSKNIELSDDDYFEVKLPMITS
ncbi:sensor histidine kinase [Roseivirga sp. E12]|uniref:sensor histidine kinase n=1 Tax=Roseivirga sp. E12 TaxID=2819237 RepID=UPI001ABC4A9A|nr:histidine kinase [Roseivirga sp. E12]MBO3699807.1 histidine kinase [Roseivirga sp. E12]